MHAPHAKEFLDLDPERIGALTKSFSDTVQTHFQTNPDSPVPVFEVLNAAAWLVATMIKASRGGPVDARAFFVDAMDAEL